MRTVDNINLNLALNTCVEQMIELINTSKNSWHSTMGSAFIKKVSIYQESLHKDVAKDSFWRTMLLQNATLIVLWLFWLKDPLDIRQTGWYVENIRGVAAITCGIVAFMAVMAVSMVALLNREKAWNIENIAEALVDTKIGRVYWDLWAWVPMNAHIFIGLSTKFLYADNFWFWFSGDIIYIICVWFWAFNNYFEDDFGFKHVFIDTEKMQIPSAGWAVSAQKGLRIAFNDGRELMLDLRKCKVTVYSKGILIIKWYKPEKLCYLVPEDYDCLEIRQINGDMMAYRFKGGNWVKEDIEYFDAGDS